MLFRLIKIFIFILIILLGVVYILSWRKTPEKIIYGVSFSKNHSDDLRLDWKKTYLAILDELKVKNIRISAYWINTEKEENKFNFEETDFQMNEAEKRGVSVVLAVGRKLPGWPECHTPDWARNLDESVRNEKVLAYIEAVVNRYKDYKNIKYWQVENEPFLQYVQDICGKPNENFLKQEVALVKKLDPSRPVLLTDGGEFGTWYKAYRNGDAFGSTMYLYIWNKKIGPFRYPVTPAFFRLKQNFVNWFWGKKPTVLIELSAEPWLLQPIYDTPIETALSRMDIDKFNYMISFAKKSGFEEQYLWGAEWWYFMKDKNHPEFWERAKELFAN